MARILIADDDAGDRELLCRALERTKATIIEAENGAQALDLARRERPELIILDILMPVISGEEVLSFIRADEALRATPIIVATGVAERGRVMRIIERGPDAYILKPFDPLDLRRKVTRFLASEKGGTRGLSDPNATLVVAVAHSRAEVRTAVCEAFRPLRFELLEAETGPGLLDQAHRKTLDLAFLDLDLPIIDGTETARRTRMLRLDQTVPLVGLAGFANVKLGKTLEEAGFGAILAPPFESWDVLEAAGKALGNIGYWRGSFEGIGVFHMLSADRCQNHATELVADMAGEIQSEGFSGQGWIVNVLAVQAIPQAIEAMVRAVQKNNITSMIDLHFTLGEEAAEMLVKRGVDEMHVHTNLEAAARTVAV